MLFAHLRRGLIAGSIGGVVYGLFVATVVVNLVEVAESFESGGHEAAVSATTTIVISVGGGVLWGLFLGIITFGVVYYLFEPAIPGRTTTRSYLLGAAGFITVSGAPWLVLPPLPPGVEQALSNDVRLLWYAVMLVGGAAACGAAAYLYDRFVDQSGKAFAVTIAGLPFLLLVGASLLAPANPTSGELPAGIRSAFRWTVVFGQMTLWFVLASVHAWSGDRRDDPSIDEPETAVSDRSKTLES